VPATTAAGVAVGLGIGTVAVAAVAATLGTLAAGLLAPIAVAGGLYAAVGVAPLVLDETSMGRLCAWVAGAGCLGALLGGVVSATALRAVLVTAPALVFLPLGAARSHRSRSVLALVPAGVALVVTTQSGVGTGWFDALVFTVSVALPWAALTLALGAVLYLAGRSVERSRSAGRVADSLPFGAGDADDG
jgi:hypothetical protein